MITRATKPDERSYLKGFVEGFYYKPHADLELLATYHEEESYPQRLLAGEVQKYLAQEECNGEAIDLH